MHIIPFDTYTYNGCNHAHFYAYTISNASLSSNCCGMQGCSPLPIGWASEGAVSLKNEIENEYAEKRMTSYSFSFSLCNPPP
jgi:hypothetical protein